MTENQLKFLQHQENVRHNTADEAERARHNAATEAQDAADLDETRRSNLANEYLTGKRTDVAREQVAIAQQDHDLRRQQHEWKQTTDVFDIAFKGLKTIGDISNPIAALFSGS